jgi:glycosyltransferase involved in cell wall biosynthesis
VRILYVAMADSIHTARWINQIADQGWDLHLFPVYSASPSSELRNVTVYGLAFFRPRNLHPSVHYIGLLPIGRAGGFLEKAAFRFFPNIWASALGILIRIIQPDILHSLEFQHSAYLTLPIIQQARKRSQKPPKWIATNWGSDLYLFGRLAEHRERVRQVLEQCDFYSCECERDVKLAQELGLTGQVLPVIPNTGGFDLNHAATLRQPGPTSQRRTILLKGYQTWAGRALVGLRALQRCADILKSEGYQVAIYSASPEVKIAAELFEQNTGINTILIPASTHSEMLSWYGQARLYLGLSISDAISTSLLEAMVMGTFPIQSCTACADEWIVDGKSGFIVPPEDPDIIENFIRRALQDDKLVDQAAEFNDQVAKNRLDQSGISPRIITYYKQVLTSSVSRKL